VIFLKKNSIAKKNVLVLILSLLPFVIGLSYSLYRSSDRNYFSKAINIAGSQRMRTILIANYAHQVYDQELKLDKKEIDIDIIDEIYTYKAYFEALKYGDSSLGMKPNNFQEIKNKLDELTPLLDEYIENVNNLIFDENKNKNIKLILANSLKIKDGFHEVTELYQFYNDNYIKKQKNIDTIMIILAAGITIVGLFLTSKIRQQEYHANFDALTKLKNRHNLIGYIEDKTSINFSIYFIDLNKFKTINDTYGHEIGDEILIEVSNRLLKVFGREALYRYGGDEFIALLEDIEGEDSDVDKKIDVNIKEVKNLLSEPIVDSYGREHFVGLAMGIISSNVAIDEWDTLINMSDDLMYDSKRIPENVVVFRTKKDLMNRIKFLKGVDNIFSKESIKLNYQPIYKISGESSSIFGITSRLEKDGEEFYASEFLHILKRKGYLVDLDKNTMRVLNSDYSDNKIKNSEINSDERYIVTLSEDTLINSGSNDFFSVINSLDIPENKIIIKIHEYFLNNKKIQESLEILRRMGFAFAIDDFTLDLSLKGLYKYRGVEFFKIDNSLVNELLLHKHSVDLLKEFVSMLVKTGKTVIIEGIDRDNLLFFMKGLSPSETNRILYSKKYTNDITRSSSPKQTPV
jgi:diguanylate cyclase (GGDEF)-like protein